MAGKTIAILGGGFGGLAAAHALRDRRPLEHRVVLIERKHAFSMGLSNLWVMAGDRADPKDGERHLSKLAAKHIEVVQESIRTVDAERTTVQTDSRTIHADYLIVALGAELAPLAIPGFQESAFNLYDSDGALSLQAALRTFAGGKIAILISRTPFKCPAAPYEAAFLIDALLRERHIREMTPLSIYTIEPQPMPVAGPHIGAALRAMLTQRNIGYFPEHAALKINTTSKRILFEIEEADFDLLIGVPPHVAPSVVRNAGLVDSTGWIPVNALTLGTRFPHVYAIGDVASVQLKNGMVLPTAGVFAEREASVVAENIAAEILGQPLAGRFDGRGACYLEVGEGKAAYGEGDFFALPSPHVTLEEPSRARRHEKELFERTRLDAWF